MKTLLLAAAALALATSANATVVTFNFGALADTAGHTTGNLTNTATFVDDGLTIVAKGFGYPTGTADLYGKHNGGDENGLGLNNDPSGDHEIYYHKGFVQLDLSSFFGAVVAGSTYFGTNSTTGGEAWAVYGSNTSGSYSGNPLLTGNTEGAHLLPGIGTYKYYDFVETAQAGGENFLVTDISTTTQTVTTHQGGAPEPASWALMIVGFGLAGAGLRRRRSATA